VHEEVVIIYNDPVDGTSSEVWKGGRMSPAQWIEDVVKKAVQKELGKEPLGISVTTERLTARKAFPVRASVRMPDDCQIDVSVMVSGDSYSEFKVLRQTKKSTA
jgi:hypothetical protein